MISKVIKLKTGSLYEEKRNYSRAVMVGDFIFVSNTAGRNYQTRFMSEKASEQAHQCFMNIEGALAAFDSSLADVVRIRIAIPHADDKESVMNVVAQKLRGIDPASTVTATPLASEDYRVEIEVTAMRGAGAAQIEYRKVAL